MGVFRSFKRGPDNNRDSNDGDLEKRPDRPSSDGENPIAKNESADLSVRLNQIENEVSELLFRVDVLENRLRKRITPAIYALLLVATILAIAFYLYRNPPTAFQQFTKGAFGIERSSPHDNQLPFASHELARLEDATEFLRKKNLSWRDLAEEFENAGEIAKASAKNRFQNRLYASRVELIETIDRKFVASYFSFRGDVARSVNCLVRFLNCEDYLEADFEKHFGDISKVADETLISNWRSAVVDSLEHYETERKNYLQSALLRMDIHKENEFPTLVSRLKVNQTGTALDYIDFEDLEQRQSEVALNILNSSLLSAEVFETVRDRSIARARKEALDRAQQRTGRIPTTAMPNAERTARSALRRNLGRATIVVGIAVEILAARDRYRQRSDMTAAFEETILSEEANFFESAISLANDASLDKDVITAMHRADTMMSGV